MAAEEFLRVAGGRLVEQFEKAGFNLEAPGRVFGGLNHELFDDPQRGGIASILESGDGLQGLVEPVERVRRRGGSRGGNGQGKAQEEA